jgi:hypothetical protein
VATTRAAFYTTISAAVNDFIEHGFDSQERLESWIRKLREAAHTTLVPESVLIRTLAKSLEDVFQRSTNHKIVVRVHPGVTKFDIEMVKPKLRAELDRRILASVNLIRYNREASIAKTLQRFAGWATAIPIGGSDVADKKEVRTGVRKTLTSLPWEERRVITDQGHKLAVAIDDIISVDNGAIAAEWLHVREGGGYQARPEHEARHGRILLIRGSWAHTGGLVRQIDGFTDDIEQPAELPMCRCRYRYIYSLRDLPVAMLTTRGKEERLRVRKLILA